MIFSKPDPGNFVRLIDALAPWLNDLVIIGGWAYRLYRLHPMAQQLAYPAVITLDKDILYIHDTIEVFGRSLEGIREEWHNIFRRHLHTNAIRKIDAAIHSSFSDVTDVIREAALMAVGRALSPHQLADVCQVGLAKIFLK